MSEPIIEIQNLGKRYRIGANKEPYLSLRDEVTKWFSPSVWRARKAAEKFWALKDVSFDVQPGEAVGIIGHNGAGKSTLLKILSQITPPTEGYIIMRGRVASLLEVGTGFHHELTGRENIYLNGAILGMTRMEIARKFDEIVSFAEVEKFLETPVKHYSSGMYVRLAFAVAAHLEPEILVVDEVLAVGDVQFQEKCIGKMGEVSRGGRTVLFVSHNLAAIQMLCNRAVVLRKGKLSYIGPTDLSIANYLQPENKTKVADGYISSSAKPYGVVDVWFQDRYGQRVTHSITGAHVDLCISYKAKRDNSMVRFAIVFSDKNGHPLTCCDSDLYLNNARKFFRLGVATCSFAKFPFAAGRCFVDIYMFCGAERIDYMYRAASINIEGGDYYGTGWLPEAKYSPVYIDQAWEIASAQNNVGEN